MPVDQKFWIVVVLGLIAAEGGFLVYHAVAPTQLASAQNTLVADTLPAAGSDADFFTSSIRIVNGGESPDQPMPPALTQLAQADIPAGFQNAPAATITSPLGTSPASTPPPSTPAIAPTPVVAPTPAPAPVQPTPAASGVDETALRYFAHQGDERRLNAEIARLKALYPDWNPPDNLNQPAPINDALLDQMWKLYGDGQYAAVRAAIADRQARDPKWTPPPDLLTRLDVAESRERLVNASNAKQWNTVVSIGAATPSLLTCADVDVLWRLAEAFGMTDRSARSRDVDLYILNNCTNPRERLATVQKALPVLADADIDALLALEKKGPDGVGEFEPVKADIARRRIGAAAKDPKLMADPADLTRIEQLARTETTADDALLLGSYYFAHDDAMKAVGWFAMAKSRADTAEIARGYAYALNTLKRPQEAEDAAYKWRDAGDENKKVYLIVATALLAVDPPVRLDPDVLRRMSAEISADKYGPGAQELGWYAYKIGQVPIASRWFGMAVALLPDDEPSAYGLALSYDRLKDRGGLAKVIRAWGPRSPRIADLANPPNRRHPELYAQDTLGTDQTRLGPTPGADLGPAAPTYPANTQAAGSPQAPVYPQAQAAGELPVRQAEPVRRQQPQVRYQTVEETVAQPQTRVVQRARQQTAYAAAPDAQYPDYQQPTPPAFDRPGVNYQLPAARPRAVARPAQARAATTRPAGCTGYVRPEQLSAMSALNRGWCLMQLNRPIEAADAFDAAVKTGGGQVAVDAAYGKSLAYLRAGLTAPAAASAAEMPQTGQRAIDLKAAILGQRAIGAYNDERYNETLITLDERAEIAPEQNDLLMMRGWCYFHLRRYDEAKRIWVAVSGTGNRDAIRALAVLDDQQHPKN